MTQVKSPNCPKCAFDNKEQHRFCSKCGEKLFKECPKCHREIGLDSIHCPFCGDNIDNATKQREIDKAKVEISLKEIERLQKELSILNAKGYELQKRLDELREKGDTVFKLSNYLFYYPGAALLVAVPVFLILSAILSVPLSSTNFFFVYIIAFVAIVFYWQIHRGQVNKILAKWQLIAQKMSNLREDINKNDAIVIEIRTKYQNRI
jgi:hypothetical protein